MPIPLCSVRGLAFAIGAAAALGGFSAKAGTYLVEWEGSELNQFAGPEIEAPFETMSGSFLVTLEPGDVVGPTAAGLSNFSSNVSVGSQLIWTFGEPNLQIGGAENGIGDFGADDIFLLVNGFFTDNPVLAGAGFSVGGSIFAATQASVTVTELRNPPAPVPLPASAPLLVGAAGGLLALRRRSKRA